jgi:YebC/PmpR family DNA-binding regulatory protein
LFTQIAKEISIAARDGGDPEINFSLRLAIEKARAANMPKDNIERAIKRGTGEDKDAADLEQIFYEGYGPHGVAMMIEVITDNRNRTVAELRHELISAGGNLADAGSVSWQFKRSAYFAFPATGVDEDLVFEHAVDAGAEDVVIGEDDIEIFAPVDAFKSISDDLSSIGIKPDEAGLSLIPTSHLELDPDQTLQVMRVVEAIEELDDVQQVYSNLEITDAAVELLEVA